jgi:hypothetical protein
MDFTKPRRTFDCSPVTGMVGEGAVREAVVAAASRAYSLAIAITSL